LDEVQAFIARNQHQFGYIMGEASRQWQEKDPVGALTVGDCAAVVKHYGSYGQLLDKVVEQQQEIGQLKGAAVITESEKDLFELSQRLRQENEKLKEFIRDINENWDCENHPHFYGMPCRACSAGKLLESLGNTR
jgi:predicted transcriptional regulator